MADDRGACAFKKSLSRRRLSVEAICFAVKVDAMASAMTIGQLAKLAGVRTSTVRFYERKRLIRPEGRTPAKYRIYSAESLQRLLFIRAAQGIGFGLKEVTQLLQLRSPTAVCKDVQPIIERRLADVETRFLHFRRARNALRDALKTCRGSDPREHCKVIERLTTALQAPLQKNDRQPLDLEP